MFTKFNGKYVGPFMEDSSDQGTTPENNQQNTTDYKAAYEKLFSEKQTSDAAHASSYAGLQKTLEKKDGLLKVATESLSTRTEEYNTLSTKHTEVSGQVETLGQSLKQKESDERKTKLEAVRSKILSKEFPQLASFEYPSENAPSLISQVEAFKEDGSVDEEALRTLFKNFDTAINERTNQQPAPKKKGEVPEDPTRETPKPNSPEALYSAAKELLKQHKFTEYNVAMDAYYKAKAEESNKK
jgi:hypothetical protein